MLNIKINFINKIYKIIYAYNKNMLDAKFVCTISALVAALVAVCSFNSNQKMEIAEGFGDMSRGFGPWGGNGLSLQAVKDPNVVVMKVGDKTVTTHQDIQNGDFYSTVGVQPNLAPRATAQGIHQALKNADQQTVIQQANGPMGSQMPQGSVKMHGNEVATATLAMDNMGKPDLTSPGLGSELAISSNTLNPQEIKTELSGGNIAYDENYEQPANIENFVVPGDKPSCTPCGRGPKYMSDPLMESGYANGNYNEVIRSLLEPKTLTNIPIGTMKSINNDGEVVESLALNRLVYANTKSRTKMDGCLLRGDVVPQSNLASERGGNFVPALAYRGSMGLTEGALVVMGGFNVGGSQVGNMAAAVNATRPTNAVAGSTFSPSYGSYLNQTDSVAEITKGLQSTATPEQRVNASMQLNTAGNDLMINNADSH